MPCPSSFSKHSGLPVRPQSVACPGRTYHVQEPIQEQYNHLAIQLALLVACLYTAVGAFRLGFVTNFLSHSVRPLAT